MSHRAISVSRVSTRFDAVIGIGGIARDRRLDPFAGLGTAHEALLRGREAVDVAGIDQRTKSVGDRTRRGGKVVTDRRNDVCDIVRFDHRPEFAQVAFEDGIDAIGADAVAVHGRRR